MNSMNRTLATVAVVFALIVVGLVTYFMVNKWHQNQMAVGRQQAQNECLEVIQKMEADMEKMRAQLETERQMRPGDEVFPTVFGTPAPDRDADTLPVDCEKVDAQMISFFNYLDSRSYLSAQDIDGGSAGFFRECAALLMADPPVNIAEMEDLFRLVKNVTHFYRVLGKNRLMLAKNILAAEERVLEPAMAVFYTHRRMRPAPARRRAAPVHRTAVRLCGIFSQYPGWAKLPAAAGIQDTHAGELLRHFNRRPG